MNDPESKTAFYNEIAARLLAFPEELERTNYMEAVAKTYGIDFDNLRRLVASLAMKHEGITARPTPIKSSVRDKKPKEDGMKQSQKLLLTWLIEDTRLFATIAGLITEDDFTEELYHRVAVQLFAQYRDTKNVNPAQIISSFREEDDQREVAGLFNARIHEVETKADREKALKETILRVKQNSIEQRSKNMDPTDMSALMKVVEDKRTLEKLEKLHISID
jgi:DNA primase